MILDLLAALRAIPKIVNALERLNDVATAQLAQRRKDEKNEMVDDIIASAKSRREQRMSSGEAERVQRDCGAECCRNGKRDLDTGGGSPDS